MFNLLREQTQSAIYNINTIKIKKDGRHHSSDQLQYDLNQKEIMQS